MGVAMGAGYLQLVIFLHHKGHVLTEYGTRLAAGRGHVDCLKFALQLGQYESSACSTAVANKNAASTRVILNHCADITRTTVPVDTALKHEYTLCDAAAVVGDVQFLDNAQSHGFHLTSRNATVAATCGQLQCLKYLHEKHSSWEPNVVDEAIKSKQFDCVEYALERGCDSSSISYNSLDILVRAGELQCLMLLDQSVHTHFANRTMLPELAARHGHFDCLAFLHSYAWSAAVTNAAAQAGQYDCLWYAIEHDCPVGEHVASALAERGNEHILLQYASLVLKAKTRETAAHAAAHGYLTCLQYVVEEQGCERTVEISKAAIKGKSVECIQYLRAQGFPFDY